MKTLSLFSVDVALVMFIKTVEYYGLVNFQPIV